VPPPPPNVDASTERAASQSTDEATGEVRDADGLIVDEYSDDAFQAENAGDALDVSSALVGDGMLDEIADTSDGISEIDVTPGAAAMDTIDTGARQKPTADGEMGLGAEPHSADDLQRASIGRALKGRLGVTRDGEVHGERMFDSPDRA